MLKNIQLHLSKEEQEQIEEEMSEVLGKHRRENLDAFLRNIPSLYNFLSDPSSTNISIFCNQNRGFNIVDYGVGRTFYGLNPQAEIDAQFDDFCQNAYLKSMTSTDPHISDSDAHDEADFRSTLAFKLRNNTKPLPQNVDCVVILGCGLGHHLLRLVKEYNVKHIIVYEPELQYFKCSSFVTPWKEILDVAKQKGANLYLQIGKDGRDFLRDLSELYDAFGVETFYLYKHYNHSIFNSVFKQVLTRNWYDLTENGFTFKESNHAEDYLPAWCAPVDFNKHLSVTTAHPRFQKNLKAFAQFFPDIHEEFKNYTPMVWLPIVNQETGEINLLNKEQLCCWYNESVVNDCQKHLKLFSEKPNKDGLLLGYTGKKLAHYLHYKFVKESEELLDEVEEEYGALPEKIQSIIQFGLGVGYQLEELAEQHEIENLFISEPIRDFFYASLYAIDWEKLLNKSDEQKYRVYINIGDDGANLFKDLLNQFYSIGPYILNNTYFYSGYYNSNLKGAVAQLREQLKLVISIGEYFDHAYYGIAHTYEGLKREYPILKKNPHTLLGSQDKQVPVFLVGNGPSLDYSLDVIKEWRDKVILVTCGTSLSVMYKNGIVPDFHAEIEQNRSTYDWATLIDADGFLKQVSLISCNGIHPDTAALYKDVFIAFKEGESSTVSALSVLGEDNVESLQFAFPTVTNFASNLFVSLGFQSIYFFGVDLGFLNNKKHHSKQSAYYDLKGKEVFDFAKSCNTALVVKGNFRPTVFTKDEFKIANMLLTQSIAASHKSTEFYNCSDGALIRGASPLRPELVLIGVEEGAKEACIKNVKSKTYFIPDGEKYTDKFNLRYVEKLTNREMELFLERFDIEIDNSDQAKAFINKQKEVLFDSYSTGRSMLFFYLFGTVNFANAFLTKLIYSTHDNQVELFRRGLSLCKGNFEKFSKLITANPPLYDNSVYNLVFRRMLKLKKIAYNKKIALFTNSHHVANYFRIGIDNDYCWEADLRVYLYSERRELLSLELSDIDYTLYCHCDNPDDLVCHISEYSRDEPMPHVGRMGHVVASRQLPIEALEAHLSDDVKMSLMVIPQEKGSFEQVDVLAHAPYIARQLVLNCFTCPERKLIFPKMIVKKEAIESRLIPKYHYQFSDNLDFVSFPQVLCVYSEGQPMASDIDSNGDRGKVFHYSPEFDERLSDVLSDEEFEQFIPRWESHGDYGEFLTKQPVKIIKLCDANAE